MVEKLDWSKGQIVSSVCLSVVVMSYGAGTCWHRFSAVCYKFLVNQH